MEKDLNEVVTIKTITEKELDELRKEIESDKDDNYLSSEPKEDRIGSYYSMVRNRSSENERRYKLYFKEDDRDPIVYRLKYYDILKNEEKNAIKAMQLYVLEKTVQMFYRKELKEDKNLKELLQKIKKAKAYYSYKMFFDIN